jgi:hypothetical protein
MGKVIRNLGIFQALWFLVVIGGDTFAIFAFGWALYHWVSYSEAKERLLLPIYGAIGIILDGALAAVGLFEFSNPTTLLPIWLIALWSIFPTTLNHGLRWCWSGPFWVLIASALGAALTYVGGARLGDLSLPYGDLFTTFVLMISWIVYFTLIRQLSSVKA